MRELHHGAERDVPEVRHVRRDDGVQLTGGTTTVRGVHTDMAGPRPWPDLPGPSTSGYLKGADSVVRAGSDAPPPETAFELQ